MYNEIYRKQIREICVDSLVDKKLHIFDVISAVILHGRWVFSLKNQILHIAQSAINVLYINIILLSYTSACYAVIKISHSAVERNRECEDFKTITT